MDRRDPPIPHPSIRLFFHFLFGRSTWNLTRPLRQRGCCSLRVRKLFAAAPLFHVAPPPPAIYYYPLSSIACLSTILAIHLSKPELRLLSALSYYSMLHLTIQLSQICRRSQISEKIPARNLYLFFNLKNQRKKSRRKFPERNLAWQRPAW